jgi:hypothetical protein
MDQVISNHVQVKHAACVIFAAHFELAHAALLNLLRKRFRLDSAKNLLDAPTGIDRFGVALLADGVAINR